VSLGQQLIQLRQDARLTQNDLADRAGVSLAMIRALEQGERDSVQLRTMLKLARAVGVQIAALRGSADSPGERMRAARRQRRLTLEELARQSGVSVTDLSALEKGKRVLSRAPTVDVLATALGLSALDLAPWLARDAPSLTDKSTDKS
jgi:transcriptional regulator with XRE-family HTH domain